MIDCIFFFQAEDGIRDIGVTGVQTCALPISAFFYGQSAPAHDSFGRRINYLRVSLTDRCNFRCVYCMPEHGAHFAPREELLRDDEIVRVVGAAAAVGFEKIRLTGGEPTIRRNLVELVRGIAHTPGIREVSMTTNGLKLADQAEALREAGLKRVNISIDSLDPEKFRSMTRGGDFRRVWAGIEAAERAGFTPLKLNSVIVRGLNDDEVCELARLTLDRPWQFRFIEMMPLAGVGQMAEEAVVPTSEIIARLEGEFGPLEFVGWFGS